MEQRIKDRFNEGIFQKVIKRYGISKNQIKILDSFESFIYEFENKTGEYILRIGHSIRRNVDLIHGEVDWINFLADRGVGVSKAITSNNGNLVEAEDDHQGGQFLATAFVKAKGESPWGKWTPALFESYGELLGKMHFHTQYYQPLFSQRKRPEWDDSIFDYVEQYLSDSDWKIREKYKAICQRVNKIPKTIETYGLIHQDAHGANLFVDEVGNITLFDFDDCCYSWFINDIAIVLFYMVSTTEDKVPLTIEFMSRFLRGYMRHFHLNFELLKEIPYFLKIREIELYSVIQRDFDLDAIDDRWVKRFMENRKFDIENDVPFIDLDFDSLKFLL